MVLIEVLILVQTTIENDLIHVRFLHLLVGGILSNVDIISSPADSLIRVSRLYHYMNKVNHNMVQLKTYSILDHSMV